MQRLDEQKDVSIKSVSSFISVEQDFLLVLQLFIVCNLSERCNNIKERKANRDQSHSSLGENQRRNMAEKMNNPTLKKHAKVKE